MGLIKVAIVDDELTSRNTIKKYLEHNQVYEVAADFPNGKSALEWLRKNSVDILLCDIQMPDMNGVELMRHVHIIYEYLPIVAISGFDDFNYVRGSLVNGAANYLLKHELTEKQLVEVLDQVREKYRIIPAGKPVCHKKGYCIFNEEGFSEEQIKELVDREEIDFQCSNLMPVAVSPDYKFMNGVNPSEYKQDVSRAIIDMLNQMLGDKYQYLIYVTKKKHLLVLISFSEERSNLFMINTLSNLVRRLQQQIIRMLDITVSIITGEVQQELKQAIQAATALDVLLEDKLYLGGNRIVSSVTAKKLKHSNREIPDNLWAQLEFEIKNNMAGCMEPLQDILDWMEKERTEREIVVRSCKKIVSQLKEEGLLEEPEKNQMVTRMKEYEEYEQFRDEILELVSMIIRKSQRSRKEEYSPVITRVIEYVNENYTKDISLEKCAEITESSYTYLSREFKRETGMRFVEFLNRKRVNKAKSLLIRENISMKQIVEMSGFRNYNYFFKVFKEIEGITPREYLAKK